MIIKKVESGPIASKSGYVVRLVSYILQPHKTRQQERVLYSGCRGFISEGMAGAQAELAAMADGAKTSPNPVLHLVMSWREGEQPTPAQVEEAVSLLLKEFGLQGHSALYALHLDTDNLHCHVAICRVHPETELVIAANRGFDLEAIHRAIARIEYAQGWERETHGRYEVVNGGQLVRCGKTDNAPKRPRQQRQDMEHRTGAKSAQRLAIEKAAPEVAVASTWDELHQRLATQGMRYVKTGSGAVVFVGDTAVKASAIHRTASLTQLQKRLGPYRASSVTTVVMTPDTQDASHPTHPVESTARGWRTYTQERQAFYQVRDRARHQLNEEQDAARNNLLVQQTAERMTILTGDWKKMGLARLALRSILAAQQAAQKLELKCAHQAKRVALKAQFSRFPDYETWLREVQSPDDADAWRYRHSQWPCFRATAGGHGTDSEPAVPKDIRAFHAHPRGREVCYSKAHVGYDLPVVVFIDKGSQIEVCDAHDDDAILAAMQLAAQKWGAIDIEGGDAFKSRCVALAAQHGIRLGNPELQARLAAARQQLRQDVQDAVHWPPMHAWAPYFLAMEAPRYSITESHARGDGTKVTERMISVTGGPIGMTVADLIQAKQRKLNGSLEGIPLKKETTIEPMFDDRLFLRITGVGEEKLRELLQAGFKARVVLEVEPGRFELLMTVPLPLAGLELSQKTICRLAQLMKTQHGVDVQACSWGDIGHALPGFASSKFPGHTVAVRSSQRQDCAKTLDMINAIELALVREVQEAINQDDGNGQAVIDFACEKELSPTAIAFAAHRADINLRIDGRRMDPSRIDAQVALRLRMTGHERADVKAALAQCSPMYASRTDQRDWSLYAQRATDFAWGPAGRRQEVLQCLQLEDWRALEQLADRTAESPRAPSTLRR